MGVARCLFGIYSFFYCIFYRQLHVPARLQIKRNKKRWKEEKDVTAVELSPFYHRERYLKVRETDLLQLKSFLGNRR